MAIPALHTENSYLHSVRDLQVKMVDGTRALILALLGTLIEWQPVKYQKDTERGLSPENEKERHQQQNFGSQQGLTPPSLVRKAENQPAWTLRTPKGSGQAV